MQSVRAQLQTLTAGLTMFRCFVLLHSIRSYEAHQPSPLKGTGNLFEESLELPKSTKLALTNIRLFEGLIELN